MSINLKICIWWSDHYGSRRLKTPPKCIGYWSMKILLEICTKAAIICLKKQNFKLKEISKNPRKNTQNSRKNPQNSREKLNFWVMWKRCPKKTLDAFIHFHTLSYTLEGFTCFHMLLYAFISFYMILYAFICFYILSYIFIYTFTCFYTLFICFPAHSNAKKQNIPSPPLRHLHHPKAQPLRGWQKPSPPYRKAPGAEACHNGE